VLRVNVYAEESDQPGPSSRWLDTASPWLRPEASAGRASSLIHALQAAGDPPFLVSLGTAVEIMTLARFLWGAIARVSVELHQRL